MRKFKAWAVVRSDGRGLEAWSHQMPLYWLRRIAREEEKRMCDGTAKVKRVTITIDIDQERE